ncbi:G5 domain-containing protein [Sporosarcina sp. ACRSM]|uniref:VanW family protein n=1 Tax=Sporosarcina sp. ACRSM TaxID=2918216 RepID=UPI001EF63955|nr:G5 domain-containing protein [Sporosarcina sp. ACRSM]MCG7336990.1 G5 domain-containing protein [Sporosarcina sp. ACRSM]
MGNKGILNTFIAVLAATLFFYGISTFGALAFSQASTTFFDDQTYVGPYDISNQKEREAAEKLTTGFNELQSAFSVNLAYQDAVVALPEELVRLDAEQTIERAKSGEENPIVAIVSVDGLRTVLRQQFASVEVDEDSLRSIATGIEKELGAGIMPLTVYITDYMEYPEWKEEEIASSSLVVQNPSRSLQQLIRALDGTEMDSFSSFSLLDKMQEEGVRPVADEELTLLASTLYALVLQTNFEVDERSIGNRLSPAVEPGFEAAINQSLGVNFGFTNPNKSAFTLHVTLTGNTIHTSLTGMPLLYEYTPYTTGKETYQPKTVRQFSAFIPAGQVRVEDEGKEGIEVSVSRLIAYGGVELADEWISSDFYAPQPRIELHALEKDHQQDADNPPDGIENPEENGPSSESDQLGGAPDKENDSEPTEEVQYDKGGNIIN